MHTKIYTHINPGAKNYNNKEETYLTSLKELDRLITPWLERSRDDCCPLLCPLSPCRVIDADRERCWSLLLVLLVDSE